MPELVLDGIRLLAKQFLGSILDMEVEQSAVYSGLSVITIMRTDIVGRDLCPGPAPPVPTMSQSMQSLQHLRLSHTSSTRLENLTG